MSVYGGDLNKLFESIGKAKDDIFQAANSSHATEEEKAAQSQKEEAENVDPVQQALAKLDEDRMEREKILAQAEEEKAKSAEQKKKSAEEAKLDQQRVAEAGANAAKEKKSSLINNARHRREQARKRMALAQAQKEAVNQQFQKDVDERVQARLRERQAEVQKNDVDDATQVEQPAVADTTTEADSEQQARKLRIQELKAEIARLQEEESAEDISLAEPEIKEQTPQSVVNRDKNKPRRRDGARIRMTDSDTPPMDTPDSLPAEHPDEIPEQPLKQKITKDTSVPDISVSKDADSGDDDGLEILEVLPSSLPVTYTGYTPVSDKQNSFASAMQPINSFDATIYLGVKYDRFSRRGAFSYYIVTADKEKNLLHSETGYTDDAYEYAFLGTLLMLQDVVKNKIRQVLIVVQDETIRDILTQNAMNVRDNFSETRSNYVDFMRVNTGVKFVANFAVLPAGSKGNHARHLSVVASLANSMVKD